MNGQRVPRARSQPFQAQIDTIVRQAISSRIFPGAVVLVAHHGRLCYHAAHGDTMYGAPGNQPATHDTIYDIASLTKVFTATAALQLCERGLLNLDEPVQTYLPALHTSAVRIRHLLTHTSGLHLRLSILAREAPARLLENCYAAPLIHEPGTVVAYTNINSLLLGEVVAQVAGMPLDQLIAASILQPLGMHTTRFCPPEHWRSRIAPTEIDHDWRAMLVHGTVHDESAHALGGVAGHAGMFSTTSDLWLFSQAWIGQHSVELLNRTSIQQATRLHTPPLGNPGGLGWMLNRPNFMGQAAHAMYGHTGFTGPAIVIAPDHELVVIILSNRTFPNRTPAVHHAVTAAIVDAALGFAKAVV